jgi:hypothetical protein
VRGGTTEAVSLNVGADMKNRIAQEGLRLLNRIDLPPGRYQLHLATEDASGRSFGSVSYDLEVPDFTKGPLAMSGLVLTSAAASARPTVRPDELLRQVLPASPVAARAFPQNDQIALFAEVYDNEAASPHKVDIMASVAAADGHVVFKTDETRDSSDIQGRRGGYLFGTRLSMKELTPGPYVVTVSAKSRLGDQAMAVRQVPFSVTPAQMVPAR